MPPVASVASPAPALSPTLAELRALELRYDGPIPPQALADLRTEMNAIDRERRRRDEAARTLRPQVRTLAAINAALGLDVKL